MHVRRPEVGAELVRAGASRATSLQELGSTCRLIFLCLPDASAVEHVLFNRSDGLAGSMQVGSCVVDTSSTSVASARDCSRRVSQRGCHYLDAPVSGGQQAAQSGSLACMVGGDASALASCREVLNAFCRVVTHVGPSGSGQIVKSCNQVAVAGALLGVAEAIALAQSQGVDALLMREVLLKGTARSAVLERHAPKIIERDVVPGFRTELMRKDLRAALVAAGEMNVKMPTTRLAKYLLDCLCSNGCNDWDWSAMAQAAQWTAEGSELSQPCEKVRSDASEQASDVAPPYRQDERNHPD